MALPPKPDDERMRANKPRWDKIPVAFDGVVRLPDLPSHIEWCPSTLRWWNKWQHSPQSMIMIDSDHEAMFEAALLHNKIWKDPENLAPTYMTNLMAELRRRVAAYGGTFEDRLKLRMDLVSPHDELASKDAIEREAERQVDYLDKMKNRVAELKGQVPTE